MVAFKIEKGQFVFPDALVRAVKTNAERRADLTAQFLEASGLSKPIALPLGFLLELGALLQLECWEREGLLEHLDADLPTSRQAAGTLGRRAQKGPDEFEGPDATPLHRSVFNAFIEKFAWEGQELLNADVLVGEVDEDQFAEVLAELLWRHRHDQPL